MKFSFLAIYYATLLPFIAAEVYNLPVDVVNENPDNKILTPHNYSFILNNPNICRKAPLPVHTLIVVISAPENWKRRMSIRRTWTTVGLYPSKSDPTKRRIVVSVFVMGKPSNESVQRRLAFEHSEFEDIVQEDFADAYQNLTYKNQLWMRFVKEFCPDARFIIKSDDDMYVNTIALLDHMDILNQKALEENATAGLGKKVWCCRWERAPVNRGRSKWHVSKSLYNASYYPPFCPGSSWVVSTEAAIAMYDASLRTPFFYLEDVWATGLVAPRAGVQLKNFSTLYSLFFGGEHSYLERVYLHADKETFNLYIFGHFSENVETIYTLWHSTLVNYGIRIMDSFPSWSWYHPNTYFPTQTHVF